MTKRTYTDKNGNEWSWEETVEVIEALQKLYEQQDANQSKEN
jgi:hypothetical protein